MKTLENKTPKVDFDNIYKLILPRMLTNKSELFEVNVCGDIDDNDEDAKIYIVSFYIYPVYTPRRCGTWWE